MLGVLQNGKVKVRGCVECCSELTVTARWGYQKAFLSSMEHYVTPLEIYRTNVFIFI